MILLCLTWVYYHYKFFMQSAKKKEALARQATKPELARSPTLKEAEDKMKEQFANVSDDEEDKSEVEEKKPLKLRIYATVKELINKVSDKIIVASSLSLGGSLIFIEGLLLTYLSEVTSDQIVESEAAFYLAIFLYFFIPTVILFGIPIISNGKNHAVKMFWIPTLSILFPLFVSMPVAYYLRTNNDSTHPLGMFLIFAPTVSTIFWITLSYIGVKRRKTKFGLVSFVFICFVIPLVILRPLIDNDGFKAVGVAEGFSVFLIA